MILSKTLSVAQFHDESIFRSSKSPFFRCDFILPENDLPRNIYFEFFPFSCLSCFVSHDEKKHVDSIHALTTQPQISPSKSAKIKLAPEPHSEIIRDD